MSEWVVETKSLIPQGQLGEFLMVARVDRVSGKVEVMRAIMEETQAGGAFLIPEGYSPLAAVGADAADGKGLNALLQAIMDCAWKRGLRPSKFDPSAGELAAVKAHLEDMRNLAIARAPLLIADVTGDIGGDEKKVW
jgi:hypothetical protein